MTSATSAGSPPVARKDAWNGRPLIVRGKLAAVYVAPLLYRRSDLPRGFLVAIWIRNLTDKPVGIDGSGESWFLHPNQWSVSDTPVRTDVDERNMIPLKLDQARRANILSRMRAGTLTVLPPGSSLESYVKWDGPAGVEIDRAKGRNFILSFDGQVLITDGKDCESLEAKVDGMTAADLILPTPVPWRVLPLPSAK